MAAFETSQDNLVDLWISSDVLSGCEEFAGELGLDLRRFLQRNGIEFELVSSERGFLPFQAVSNFLEDIAASHGIPDFGFRLGRNQRPLQYGIISQVPIISPTIGDAFRNFIRYQKLYSQSSHWELVVDDDCAMMRRHDVAKSARASPQLIILSLTMLVSAVRAILGRDWQPAGVYFGFDSFSYIEAMRSHFGCPVFCGSPHNEVALELEDLERPIVTSNPALLKILTNHFDQLLQAVPASSDITSQVFHQIRSNLGDHRCNLDWTAKALRMHPRTLQRLLIEEGTSFRELLQKARIELADYMLRLTRTPISEISALLGYSNVSAFSRAFEKIRGHSPSTERAKARRSVAKR